MQESPRSRRGSFAFELTVIAPFSPLFLHRFQPRPALGTVE